jgi:flagellar motor protein MotB
LQVQPAPRKLDDIDLIPQRGAQALQRLGVADREPLVRENPADPRNRRISILLMR